MIKLRNKICSYLKLLICREKYQKLNEIQQIEYIEKLENEKEKIIALQETIKIVSGTLDIKEVLDIILDKIVAQLGFKTPSVFLVDKSSNSLCVGKLYGTSIIMNILEKGLKKPILDAKLSLTSKENLMVKAVITGKMFYTNDLYDFSIRLVSKSTAYLAQKMYSKVYGMKRMVAIPLSAKGEILGVLTVSLSEDRDLNKKEEELLASFTSQAAIAIYNAQQFEQIQTQVKQLEEKTEDMESLLDISEVAGSSLKTKNVAQRIVDSIPENLRHLGYEGGILVLYNKREGYVYTYALTESKIVKKAKKLLNKSLREHLEYIDQADNFVIKTIKTKKMQVGSKLEEFIAPTVSKKVCGLIQKLVGAKSFISIPLLSGGRIKGTIVFVGVKPKKKIVQRDKDILFGFSSHIGAAIENAQLYEQTEKQIKALSILNENLKMANIKMKELMEIKNEFLHITSHQLRTPLTTIRGMISMWYSGDFDDLSEKEKRKMLKRIYISSERLNNITNDMLDSLELEGGFMKFQFKQMSLREIIKETVDIMKPNFNKKNLYLELNDNIDIPKVEVEPNYIRQVFVNTIDNACKYTKKGGVEVNIKKIGKYVEVAIKDTGIGVSESDQKKIFLKFTRGKRASAENASGSGLGLFIAKKIVDAHNGKIEFISKGAGKGSVVKVRLLVKQG